MRPRVHASGKEEPGVLVLTALGIYREAIRRAFITTT